MLRACDVAPGRRVKLLLQTTCPQHPTLPRYCLPIIDTFHLATVSSLGNRSRLGVARGKVPTHTASQSLSEAWVNLRMSGVSPDRLSTRDPCPSKDPTFTVGILAYPPRGSGLDLQCGYSLT